jgi:hypothetical protein
MKNITIGIIAREEKINNTSFEAITKNNLNFISEK